MTEADRATVTVIRILSLNLSCAKATIAPRAHIEAVWLRPIMPMSSSLIPDVTIYAAIRTFVNVRRILPSILKVSAMMLCQDPWMPLGTANARPKNQTRLSETNVFTLDQTLLIRGTSLMALGGTSGFCGKYKRTAAKKVFRMGKI